MKPNGKAKLISEWHALQARYTAADKQAAELDSQLARKYGRNYQSSWLTATEKKKTRTILNKKNQASDRMFGWLRAHSPWDFELGTAAWWVATKLTAEKALALSPPVLPAEAASYGQPAGPYRPNMREGVGQMAKQFLQALEKAGH